MLTIQGRKIADAGFYLNLDSSLDRKERVESQIEKYDIKGLERFSSLKDNFIQYSCTKTHIAALQYCYDNDIESVLILEDDFQIYDECKIANKNVSFLESLDNVLNDMDKVEWDVILLGCNPRTYLIPITDNLAINSKSTGGWAYIIKKKAYKYIIDNLNYHKDLLAIDDYLPMLNVKGFTSLCTIPLLINHGINLESTLQPRGPVNYDQMIEGNYYNFIYNFMKKDKSLYDIYEVERELTIVITGHFVDNFLFYLRYLLMTIPTEIEKCRFIIIYDTAHNSVNFNTINELKYYFKNRDKPINYDLIFSNGGLVDSVKLMLELLKTKYFIFLEHDWIFLDNNRINFKELMNCMDKYDYVNAVWFNKDDNQLRGFEICGDKNGNVTPYEREERISEINLTKTIRWSNNPVIFRTSKYQEWFDKYIDSPTIGVHHQGQYNVEDNMINEYRRIISESVWEEIKDDWGTYLYGDVGEGVLVGHTDGSRRYQDSIKTMAEDNANEFIKNNKLPDKD
jgi:hypothetical protein